MDVDVRGVAVGFAAAAVVLFALVFVVGLDGVLRTLGMMDGVDIAAITAVALVWLGAWALALRTVLAALGVEVRPLVAFLLFTSATFANNITPFGQAGGEPFSALLISRAADTEYERGLAAIASVDTINFIPSIVLSVLGLGYYVVVFTVGDGLLLVTVVVAVLAVTVPVVGYLGWTNRRRVQAVVVSVATPVARWIAGVLPWFEPPARRAVRRRVRSFSRAIERVADDKVALAEALGFSALGWLCMVLALWLAMSAVGSVGVPLAAALIAVPVGTIASITPLPGGAGGVELAIVLVIVPITAVDVATATSAALVYRGATYWFPTVVGGGATAVLEGRAGQ